MAATGFPVALSNPLDADWLSRTRREGRNLTNGSVGYVGNVTPGSQSGGGLSLGSTGANALWGYYIESVILSANKECTLRAISGQSSISGEGTVPQLNLEHYFPVPGWVEIPVNKQFGALDGVFGLRLKELMAADGTNFRVSMAITGFEFTDDPAWWAKKKWLQVGDSICNGSGITSATDKMDFHLWKMRNWLRETQQVDVRLINNSQSGTGSIYTEAARQLGKYDYPDIDLITYTMGANDVATSTSVWTDNINAWISWKQKVHPKAKLLFLSCTPLENNTSEAAVAALRTIQQNLVTAARSAGDTSIYYINLGGSFDRTVSSNYVSTDSAGSRIHPNASTGMRAIWTNALKPGLEAINLKF